LKDGAFECAVLLVCCSGARRQHHAGEREEQRGDLAGAERSCSATAAVTTPITGTAMVPIAATEAGSRESAANQLT